MLDRFAPYLKWVCLGLLLLVVAQGVRLLSRPDPLADVVIPATPVTGGVNDPPEVVPNHAQGNPIPGPAPKQEDLPPEFQARLAIINQSEILGAVPKPPPMALLGIAGRQAILRAPNGQEGKLKEGEELGGIKLIRIGNNRVLIEHEGRLEELTIFAGLGGEPLLEQGKENSK